MFPIKDYIPRRHSPYAVRTIIFINTVVFLMELFMPRMELVNFFNLYGVVPARYFHPVWARWMGYPHAGIIPFFTYMFIHGGLLHYLGNMWVLWVFADNVEDIMGPYKFVLFYFICGFSALAGHMFVHPDSTLPVIGASGAIAGIMGAYLILYPSARVLTLIPIFIFPLFVNLPAWVFLGIWFGIQLVSGIFSSLTMAGAGGVAWWAHAFGFLAGILFLPLFRDDKGGLRPYPKDQEFLFK